MTADATEFFEIDVPPRQSRPLHWCLADAPAPMSEPTDEEGRAEMLAELDRLPFLQAIGHVVAFVGEGRRLTKQGELFAVDRRQLESRLLEVDDHRTGEWYGNSQILHVAWNVLLSSGLLVKREGHVEPAMGHAGDEESAEGAENALRRARSLLAAALESSATSAEFAYWDDGLDEDGLDALLVASGPEGLLLPRIPPDGELIHCGEVVQFMLQLLRHPYIREVPIDRRTGHPLARGLGALERLSRTMGRLRDSGLLLLDQERPDREGTLEGADHGWAEYGQYPEDSYLTPMVHYRAPVAMRGAIAMVRDRRSVALADQDRAISPKTAR